MLSVAALFAGYSLLHEPVPGVNEPHYLCKAKATWDSDYCASDFFLKSESAHSVFFWLVGYFTQYWSLQTVAVWGRVISAVVLAWGWTALSAAFLPNRGGAVISAALLGTAGLTGNLSGEWVLGGFESKVPAWGLGFAGTACWLRTTTAATWRSWLKIGVLLGLSTTAHPVVGAWFLIAISMSELAQLFSPVARWLESGSTPRAFRSMSSSLLTMNGVALIAALPGVLPALQVVASTDLSHWQRGTANRIQVFMRLGHHLDPAQFPPAAWIHSTALLTVIVCCSWRLLRSGPRPILCRHLLLLISAGIVAAAGVALGSHAEPVVHLRQWSWRAFLLKFYPFRLIDILLPVTAALMVTILVLRTMQNRTTRFITAVRRMLPLVMVVGVFIASWRLRPGSPAGYSPQEYSTWQQACDWIRIETPKDSLFVTPREAVAFKWYAERAQFVCYKDCPQDGAGILEWRKRLRDIARMSPAQLQGALKPSDLIWMQGHMEMTHLITRRHFVVGQVPVYENAVWRIYDVKQNAKSLRASKFR